MPRKRCWRVEQPLRRRDVEAEQARERQVDRLHLLERDRVVERLQLRATSARQRQRRVGAQRGPFGPREDAVGRQAVVNPGVHSARPVSGPFGNPEDLSRSRSVRGLDDHRVTPAPSSPAPKKGISGGRPAKSGPGAGVPLTPSGATPFRRGPIVRSAWPSSASTSARRHLARRQQDGKMIQEIGGSRRSRARVGRPPRRSPPRRASSPSFLATSSMPFASSLAV